MHCFYACKLLGVWRLLYFHGFLSHQFILHIGDTHSSSTFTYKQQVQWSFWKNKRRQLHPVFLHRSTWQQHTHIAGLCPALSHWPFPMLTLGNQAPKHWFRCRILHALVLATWILLDLALYVYSWTTSLGGNHQTHLFLCPHMALPEKARGSHPKSFA